MLIHREGVERPYHQNLRPKALFYFEVRSCQSRLLSRPCPIYDRFTPRLENQALVPTEIDLDEMNTRVQLIATRNRVTAHQTDKTQKTRKTASTTCEAVFRVFRQRICEPPVGLEPTTL